MRKKGISVLSAVVMVAVASLLLTAGCSAKDTSLPDFKRDFESFKKGVAKGDKKEIAMYVSKNFTDKELDYGQVVDIFVEKKGAFNAIFGDQDIKFAGDNRIIFSYLRQEGRGKEGRYQVKNEIWVREGDGFWRLFQLSNEDKERIAEKQRKREEELERLFASLKMDINTGPGVYFPGHTRDPFESLIIEMSPTIQGSVASVAKRCDPNRAREFLESYDLLSLQFVGVVLSGDYLALIEAPNGNGYTLKRGMYLGRNCGKVVKITQNSIVVGEKYLHPKGGIKQKKTELILRQEES